MSHKLSVQVNKTNRQKLWQNYFPAYQSNLRWMPLKEHGQEKHLLGVKCHKLQFI